MSVTTTGTRYAAWSYVLDEATRVLLADDDPILREFAIVHLSSPGATIVAVGDGRAALDALAIETFDIVLLDIEMPVLDGFGALEQIRSEPRLSRLPVMMLTGHEDIASIDRAFHLGANAFSSKPVNWRLLSYQIRYVLRSSRIEQRLRERLAPSEILVLDSSCPGVLQAIPHETAAAGASPTESQASAETCLRRIGQLAPEALRERLDDRACEVAGDAAQEKPTLRATGS